MSQMFSLFQPRKEEPPKDFCIGSRNLFFFNTGTTESHISHIFKPCAFATGMPADRDKGKSKANNPTSGNQHSSRPLLEQYLELPQWIQGYIDNGIKQTDMPRELSNDHGITVKLCCIEHINKNQNLRTSRYSGLTDINKGATILAVTQEDPLA
ncbi:hypothetical protein B0H14DRAFT_2646081 [Mycena olivaceomarginata]|nr:hypothetical protein B0H14DRAFT_2646081 [Mycena olivaceomarginata]